MSINLDSVNSLDLIREDYTRTLDKQYKKVIICGGTGCVAGGAFEIYDRLKELIAEKDLLVDIELEKEEGIGIKKSGCHGFCEAGPLIRIEPEEYLYLKVTVDDCYEIVDRTLINNEPIKETHV